MRNSLLAKIYISSLIFAGSLFVAHTAKAHQFGVSLEKEVDGYFVDIGHSEELLEVGDSVRFDFSLFTPEDKQKPVEFSDMWVRISQGNKTIFAGNLNRPSLGKTGMTTVFPEPGEYELSARYHLDEATLVETSFPLSVEPDPSASKLGFLGQPIYLVGGGIGILILGFIIGFMVSGLFVFESVEGETTKTEVGETKKHVRKHSKK